jgi:cytochrome d ubiquinol oxidase subunit I
VVYGLMRTASAVTPTLTGADVAASLLLYVAVYAAIFGAGLWYLVRLVRSGPPLAPEAHAPRLDQRAARPISALTEDA